MPTFLLEGNPPPQPQRHGGGEGGRPASEFHNHNFIHYQYVEPLLVYSVSQTGGRGHFTHPRETTGKASLKDLFTSQPAQFQPRTDWSHWPDSGPARLSIWDSDRTITQKLSISQAAPSPAFRDGAVVGGHTWLDHQVQLWSTFASIEKKQSFGVNDPLPLLTLIRSGLESQVGIMMKPLILESTWKRTALNPQISQFGHNPLYHAGAELLVNPISEPQRVLGFETAAAWKREMFNRRFFIGFVANDFGIPDTLVGDYGNLARRTIWSSFIWDRHRAHLYIYNAYSSGYRRDDLIIRIGLAFRQVLATNGMPFDFDVFSPPVTQLYARDFWASGVVAANLLLINIRGLVGVKCDGLVRSQAPRNLVVDGERRLPKYAFALRHRDWDTEPWNLREDRVYAELEKACDVIRVMIMDELGIKDLTFDQGRHSPALVSLTDRSPNMTYLPQSSADLRSDTNEVYTNLGGPQYVVFSSRKVHPSRAMRLVKPPVPPPAESSPSLPHSRPHVFNLPRPLVPVPLNVALLYLKQGLLLYHDEVSMLPPGMRFELADCARRPGVAVLSPRVRDLLLAYMCLHILWALVRISRRRLAQRALAAPASTELILRPSMQLILRPQGFGALSMPTSDTRDL